MDIGGLVYAEQWTCLRLVEGSKRWQCWLMMELTRWSLLANDRWKRQWQWQIPGEDSRQVTDEKDDDSRDKNNREITISRLLGCSSLAQFIWKKYLSDRHRNNWKQSLLTEYHYYIIIYNIYKPVVEEPFVTVFPISNRHLRLRKLRRRKGGGFWLYTEDSLKITCGMS